MHSKFVMLIGGLVIAALAVGSLVGQQAPQQAPGREGEEPAGPKLILRQYNVAPLLVERPQDRDFAALMDMNRHEDYYSGGTSLFDDPSDGDKPDLKERLRTLIERTVRSEQPWVSMGGRATLDFYEDAGLLLISQTAQGQAQVAELLTRLIAEKSRTLIITVKAVELDPTFRDALLDSGWPVARTPEQKKALTAAIKQVYCRTTLSGLSNQLLCSNSGSLQSYVIDVDSSVAEASSAYDPAIAYIPNGLATRVRPTLLGPDSAAVQLAYTFCYARLKDLRQGKACATAAGEPPGQAESAFDLPTADADQRAGTISVPLGCPTLVGGGTVPKRLVSGQDTDTGAVELDYIVTVHVVQP